MDILTRQTSKIVRQEAAGDDNRKNSEASTRYGTVCRGGVAYKIVVRR